MNKCKHEFRYVPGTYYSAYYCIHCLLVVKNKTELDTLQEDKE